jgi:LuxR family maltose regulon positive regulatory protein
VETMLAQSRRALEYLHPNNLSTRASAYWTLGFAYALQGDRAATRRAFTESISLSQACGAIFTAILATIGLGNVQEADNQLYQAAETYRRVLQWAGDKPQQIISEAHVGLSFTNGTIWMPLSSTRSRAFNWRASMKVLSTDLFSVRCFSPA